MAFIAGGRVAGAFRGAADEAALQVIGDPLTTSLVMGLEVLRSLAAVENAKDTNVQ